MLVTKDGERAKLTWPLVRRVLSYAKPYRWQISLMLTMILTSTLLGLLQPLIFRDLIDNTLPQQDLGRLNILAIGLLLIPLVGGMMQIWQSRLNAVIGEGVIYDLRVSLYRHLQYMSLRFFTNNKTGELMSRLNNDVSDAQRAITNTTVDLLTNIIQLIATVAVMFSLEWRLTVAGILVLPLFIPFTNRSSRQLRDIARAKMNDNATLNVLMNETLNISGVLLVKLFGRRQDEIKRFSGHAAEVRDMGIKRAVVNRRFLVLTGLVGAVGTALVYWIGGYFVLKGAFTIGTIVAFTAYLNKFYGTMQNLSNAPITFATALVSFERVFELIDLPLEIEEKANAHTLERIEGRIDVEAVSFRYTSSDDVLLSHVARHGQMHAVNTVFSGSAAVPQTPRPFNQAREYALENVSFTIKAGQLVALVGPSGAGKTTLTYLIPRLYDPTAGRILIDSIDLRQVTLDSLAKNIGMVTQETHLFHDTIRTNLLYAKLNATQAEIEAACRAANIHDFIEGLPDGYHTIVGERGYRLSGGEKQRLAIARVILKNPRILILDEATSHLDSQSEALIQAALQTVMQGRTSIVIAHRLSTIIAADLILVLNRGTIVEQGTHQELLAANGLYTQLYETQFKHAENYSTP